MPLHAQSMNYGREINEFNGLISDVSRVTFVDRNGSIWIGTDAGLSVFPSTQSHKKNICNVIRRAQVWGLQQFGQHLFVGTFDSGLYQFDINTSQLIKHWKYNDMPRIRRLRYLNEILYVIHGKGVTQITPYQASPLYPKRLAFLDSNDFPMDVFTVKGKLYVAFYIARNPITQNLTGEWHIEKIIPAKHPKFLSNQIICAKEINGKTFVSLFPNRYAVIENNQVDLYVFDHLGKKQLTIWDIDGYGEDVYFAIGNNLNLNEGFHWKHDPNGGKIIRVRANQACPYTWDVLVDPYYRGVWWSNISDGVYFEPNRHKWIEVPGNFRSFKKTKNYVVAWNHNHIYIKHNSENKWTHFNIEEAPIDLLEFKNELFLLDNQHVFSYKQGDQNLNTIVKTNYSSFQIHQNKLYLFRIFGMADYYDLKTKTHVKKFNPDLSRVVNTAKNDDILLIQQENSGYYILENGKLTSLQTDFVSENSKHKFFFISDYLITRIGNKIRVSRVSRFMKKIITLKEFSLLDLFPDTPIEWIKTDNTHLILGNNEIAFVLKINPVTLQLNYESQYYLGQSPFTGDVVQVADNSIYKKGQFCIMRIAMEPQNTIDYNAHVSCDLLGNKVNFETLIARTWEGQSLNFNTESENFIYWNRGYHRIEIWKDDRLLEDKFMPIRENYVLDNFEQGVYAFHVQTTNQKQHLLFRINRGIFYNIGFWLILFATLLLLGYVLFGYQKEKLLLNQKIVSLQLNTLKANLNPHFVFNIMNLIQSLIVKSEKHKALKATGELATLNRLFLETTNKDLISLKEELEFASKYMSLEQMRFEEDSRIKFELDIAQDIVTETWFLPPLILQPLLENAMKHGKFNLQGKETEIYLRIEAVKPDTLLIEITNPINKSKRRRMIGTNLGLSLVKDRLALFNERYFIDYHAEFSTHTTEDAIFQAQITLQKKHSSWISDS